MAVPNGGPRITGDGDIVLTKQLLDYLVRAAFREFAKELSNSMLSGHMDDTVKKPDGWDDILTKLKYGKLTAHKAAKMAGMSVTEFNDYASGKKTFD